MTVAVPLLYVVSFALIIVGLSGLTAPRTAVRGNKVAAAGMAVAVLAALLAVRHNWLLILVGLLVGAALGVPAARRVRTNVMPQMVALFDGVGGGAVALVAWSQFRTTRAFADEPVYVVIAWLFGAVVGSVSFGGSLVALGTLRGFLPGRPLGLGRARQVVNLLLLASAAACAASAAIGGAQAWMVGLLVLAAVLGVMVALPIGGADVPVVIALLNASTGLSAAAAGLALDNTAMIVAGTIVGASGAILTNLVAAATDRSIPAIVASGFGGTSTAPVVGDPAARTVAD
jgi:NAD(P) transhydrogenase subunit beta